MFNVIVNYLEPFACLLYVLGVMIYHKKHKKPANIFLLVYYFLASVLLTIGAILVEVQEEMNNIWAYDLVGIAGSVFIGLYFYRILQSAAKKKTVITLTTIFFLYVIIRNATLSGPRLFDSIGYAILSASVAAYVFMYFHQVLKNVSEVNILKEFSFWLSSGYLFYFIGSFIIFVSYHYFTLKILKTYTSEERDILTALWGLHNVLLFLSALSLLIGSLWVTYRRKLE